MADDGDDLELEVRSKAGVSKKTLIIVVAVCLLVMILGIVTTVLVMGGKNSSDKETKKENVAAEGGHGESAAAEDGHGKSKKSEPIYYDIKQSFVINYLTEKGRIRYAQIHVQLLTHNTSIQEALNKNLPLIQDGLVKLFSAADFEQIQTFEGKEKLKAAALDDIQQIMKDQTGQPGVEAVLFTSFVVQ